MKSGLPLIKSVLTPPGKSVSFPFGLSAGISAADAAIQKIYIEVMDQEVQR